VSVRIHRSAGGWGGELLSLGLSRGFDGSISLLYEFITMPYVTQQDVAKKIRNLRKEAAAGPDGISPQLLKDFESSLSLPLQDQQINLHW
jgi:hypothetical protein